MIALLAFLSVAASPQATLRHGPIILQGPQIHVEDVVTLRCGASCPDLGQRVIARGAAGRRVLSGDAVASLVRRAVPSIAILGTIPKELVLEAPLTSAPARPKVESLAPTEPIVKVGDTLSLVSRVGPATIVRRVTAAQAASRGDRRIFVRDEDGALFSVPLDAKAGQ